MTLVKAAGGLTSEASGGLRVIREGRYINVDVPYRINDSVTYHPRLRFDLFPGGHGGRPRSHRRRAKENGGLPPPSTRRGATVYAPPVSARDFTFEPEKAPPPREQPVANIGVLGVGPRPVLLRLPAGGSTLEDILTRLNQPLKGNGKVTVLKPGEGPLSVSWTDARNIGLVGDTVCVFDAKTLDTSSLPEFAEPVVIPGEAVDRIARGADTAPTAPDRSCCTAVRARGPRGRGPSSRAPERPFGTNDIPAPANSRRPVGGDSAVEDGVGSRLEFERQRCGKPCGIRSAPPALPSLAAPSNVADNNISGNDSAASSVTTPPS